MKKISILALALVFTLGMLTGCGCRNSKPMNTQPTPQRPTNGATSGQDSTTQNTTQPTIQDGNGPMEDSMTNATAGPDGITDDTTPGGNSRSGGMGGSGITGGNGGAGSGMGTTGGAGTAGRSGSTPMG